jgi:hypothetical protein
MNVEKSCDEARVVHTHPGAAALGIDRKPGPAPAEVVDSRPECGEACAPLVAIAE